MRVASPARARNRPSASCERPVAKGPAHVIGPDRVPSTRSAAGRAHPAPRTRRTDKKTAVLLATTLVAAGLPAMAQQAPSPATGQPTCTQLELSAGLRGDQCGRLSLAEIAELITRRDNPIDRMD